IRRMILRGRRLRFRGPHRLGSCGRMHMTTPASDSHNEEVGGRQTGSLKPRRVAICTSGGRVEGVGRVVLSYAAHLRREIDLEPFVFLLEDSLLASRLRTAGVSVIVFSTRWKYDFGVIKQARAAILEHKIDLVHTHGYKATVLFGLAAKSCRVPVVKTE